MNSWYLIVTCLPSMVCFGWAIWFLLLKEGKDTPQQFLGWFMGVGFILYLVYIPYFLHRIGVFVHLLPVYTAVSLLVYPMYHYYVRLLVEVKEIKVWQRMYLPAVIFGSLIYAIKLWMSPDDLSQIEEFFKGNPHQWYASESVSVLLLMSVYHLSRLVFTFQVIFTLFHNFRLIHRYQKELTSYYSDPENHSLHPLKYILIGLIVTSLYSVVANSIGVPFFLNRPWLLIMPAGMISMLIFFMGYQGNRLSLAQHLLHPEEEPETFSDTELVFSEGFEENFKSKFLGEKIFLVPGIKITTVCELLETNRTYLSVYINKTYQCNFCTLINRLRVQHSLQQLNQDSIGKYSMNYLSERCGFSSLNTFYRTFNKEFGMTPGQYLKLKAEEVADIQGKYQPKNRSDKTGGLC
ncbi:MAG: helix-turn-helix transcriptional regulator [Marinilabiliales bacterium]|nr:helix-turn-helix transcriptional regulator [Marinilabiliales bacterium]